MAVSTFSFLATCVPGAEPWLEKELVRLGLAVSNVEGGVEGRAALAAIRSTIERTKLAEAIRVRPCQSFVATSFEELQRGLRKIPWHAYLVPAYPLEVRVTCKQSRLYHSDAVAERVRGAILRGPNQNLVLADGDDINAHRNRVYVRIHRDRVQVSLDAAGEALHRRGYRSHIHEAPLRETLAALLVALAIEAAGQPITRVWDPFCGSGTIPLEWLLADNPNVRKGLVRRYIMDEWPCAKSLHVDTTQAVNTEPSVGQAWLTDIAERAIEASRANAEALGVSERCTFLNEDFEAAAAKIPDATAVVTNVPYGVRLNTPLEVTNLLVRLDSLLVRRKGLRPAIVLWAGHGVPRGLRAKWQHVLDLKNGGVSTSIISLR